MRFGRRQRAEGRGRSAVALVLLICVSGFVLAAPTGKLAFIRDGGVFVGDVNGYPKLVSKSARAKFASIAPDGRSLVFFNQTDSKVAPLQGFIARAPFDSSAPLTLPVSEFPLENLSFSPDSSGLFVTGSSTGWKLEIPEFKALLGAPNPKAQALKFAPLSSAKDGSLMAFVAGSDVRIMNKNKEKMIFTPAKPETVLEQVKTAASSNAAFLDLMVAAPTLNLSNWLSGGVGLRPDGNILYFASNLGTGVSETGNSSFAFFAVQLSTMRIRLLSKLGVFHGVMPSRLVFSPDGSKFLFSSTKNATANDWLLSEMVVDLNLEKAFELLGEPPTAPKVSTTTVVEPQPEPPVSTPTGEQLLEAGATWSPDSKFVAFSLAKFAAVNPVHKIFIKDITTNRTLLKIPNATQPSWGAN